MLSSPETQRPKVRDEHTAKDGGPAFPPQDRILVAAHIDKEQIERLMNALAHDRLTGMSLRDYFAGQALTGLIVAAGAVTGPALAAGRNVEDEGPGYRTSRAYVYADEMLKARESQS